MLRRALLVASLASASSLAAGIVGARPAHAADCRTIGVDFVPAASPNADAGLRMPLQIVAWLEDANGTFVETVFITQQVGTYGLGNRPGRFDFNSAPLWPYGRRITVFPVWAHRHGLTFPEVVFQNGDENNLSHASQQSSADRRYCAPLQRLEPEWDAMSCASVAYTDKGKLSSGTNLYPPRQDFTRDPQRDSVDVAQYAMLNPFDAVSQATPPDGVPAAFAWPIDPALPDGEYVLWLEVAREFDHNATYSVAAYPAPMGIPWADFGVPYRGQPSVLYRVPFTLEDGDTVATALDYAGYGDPDGLDGDVRAPDGTITTDTPGSGAARLAIAAGGDYRVRVVARSEPDGGPPAAAADLAVESATNQSVTVAFVAPGDDGVIGQVKTYEVRYVLGGDITEETFAGATLMKPEMEIVGPGALQTITLDKLLPDTAYTLGIRAIDDCGNAGPVTTLVARTLPRVSGEVSACFIATAAYGSPLASEVASLRQLRDTVLRKSVLGELFVETYYTFGPAVAGVVGESELLRWTARELLAPIVRFAVTVRGR